MSIKVAGEGEDNDENEKKKEDAEYIGAADSILGSDVGSVYSFAPLGSTFDIGSVTGSLGSNIYTSADILSGTTFIRQLELQSKIDQLTSQLRQIATELKTERKDKEDIIHQFNKVREQLAHEENLRHLVGRVSDQAFNAIYEYPELRKHFEKEDLCEVVVLSIDIRRSTDLMLKAKIPEIYADFISELCKGLLNIVVANFGVFDKYTGDGIIAFFPYFFSGNDALLWAMKSAFECHVFFADHYRRHRHCFISVLKDIGLGIGIDSGKAFLTRLKTQLLVVGIPVVYACRMSGADYGETLLNQTAIDVLREKYGDRFDVEECDIDIKHEGPTVAYKVGIEFSETNLDIPKWAKQKSD